MAASLSSLATTTKRRLRRPLHRANARSPSPAIAGADGASSLVLAAHVFRPSYAKPVQQQISEPDLRRMKPAVVPAVITITLCKLFGGFRFALPTLQTKERKAERRKTQFTNLRFLRSGARLARRARLPAFHHGSCLRDSRIPKAQPQATLPGTRPPVRAGVRPAAPARLQRAPRVPVIVPAG
jgi:hypothetical protein